MISVPRGHILLLPREGTKLWRTDDQGHLGYFQVHVYRDHQVEEGPPDTTEIWLSPLHELGTTTAPDYVADLTNAAITHR